MQRWMKSCLVAAHLLHIPLLPSPAESSLPASDRGQRLAFGVKRTRRQRQRQRHTAIRLDGQAPHMLTAAWYQKCSRPGRTSILPWCGRIVGRVLSPNHTWRQRMHLSGKTWRGRTWAHTSRAGDSGSNQPARPIQQHGRCTDRPSISVFSPVGNARPFSSRTHKHSPSKPPWSNLLLFAMPPKTRGPWNPPLRLPLCQVPRDARVFVGPTAQPQRLYAPVGLCNCLRFAPLLSRAAHASWRPFYLPSPALAASPSIPSQP